MSRSLVLNGMRAHLNHELLRVKAVLNQESEIVTQILPILSQIGIFRSKDSVFDPITSVNFEWY